MSNHKVTIETVTKQNDTKLHAVCIAKENIEFATASPAIYLEPYYEQLLTGKISTEFIIKDMLEQYEYGMQLLQEENSIATIAADIHEMANYILPCLINTAENTDYLNDKPHRDMEDLSIMYRIFLPDIGHNEFMSIPVTCHIAEHLNMDEPALYEMALSHMENTMYSTARFTTLKSTVEEIIHTDIPDKSSIQKTVQHNEHNTPYILTNKIHSYGAAEIFNRKIMKEVNKMIGSFYVIPCSIHEMLIVKEQPGVTLEQLRQTTKEANRQFVDKSEILSDNIYRYDQKTNTLRIAGGISDI